MQQQAEEQRALVGETERGCSSLRSIRRRRSLQRRPMERPDARGERREGVGTGALVVVVVVDQMEQGQTEWQNVEWAGVSQGQPFLLIISISITIE